MITDQKKPTANFADWNYLSEEEQRGDVLRLFGQILGLELEHRHLDFDPGWKSESKIESLWEGDINDIPWEELKEYVFTPLEKADIEQTAKYDEESIMIWPFPRGYAVNTARDYNNQLSDLDMDFIGELYPRENLEKVITFRLIYLEGESHGPQGLELYLWTSVGTSWKTIPLVDYGDGTIHSEVDRYIYSETGIYDVTVYADPSEITNISINGEAGDDNVIVGLNLYGLTNLLDLDLGNIADSHLDLSQSPNLKGVSITNAYFDSELIAANIDKFSWDYFKKISEAPITFNLHGLESLSTIDLYNVLNPQFYNLYYCTNLKSINIDNNFYMNGGLIAGYPASETRSVETSSSDEGLLNIVNNLPSNSGKIKIKNSNNSDLTKINNIVSSKGWTLEN